MKFLPPSTDSGGPELSTAVQVAHRSKSLRIVRLACQDVSLKPQGLRGQRPDT